MQFDIIATGMGFTEGPAWAPDGTLWHVSIPHSAIYNLAPDGTILNTVVTKGGPNGLAIAADGTIFIAQNGGAYGGAADTEPGIQTYKDGRLEYILRAAGPDAPNDLCFGPDGRLYFTDPRGDDGTDPTDPSSSRPGRLYSCERDGSDLRTEWADGPTLINGLAFNAEGDALYVLQTMTPQAIWRLPFSPSDGLGEPERLADVEGFPDGMAIDVDGNIWVASTHEDAIQVLGPDGRLIKKVRLPEHSGPANVCFGGEGLDILFVAGSEGGRILRADAEVPGLPLRG